MSEQKLKVGDRLECNIIRVRMIQQEIELAQSFDFIVKDKDQELQMKGFVDEQETD